jgi:hypothetical protein
MRRSYFLAPLCLLICAANARAQSVDLGVQFSTIRFSDLEITDAGFGGRITFNATRSIAFEAEVNYFPKDKRGPFEGGRKTQALVGLKTGFRSDFAGIFSKLRPGFIRFSRDFLGNEDSKTDFALDIGGVLELYPSGRGVIRFDLGDTIIRFGERSLPTGATFPSFTSHNFQFSVGVGIRF